MNVSIILAHPNPDSFNHAIAQTAKELLASRGIQVFYHDLYQEEFHPVLPAEEILRDADLPEAVSRYCEEIKSSDGIIIVHPNWWGQPPAILKGWVDRVLRPDIAYRFREDDSGEGVPEGLLKAKVALVFNTSNTPVEREINVFADPLQTIWENCIFGLCGVNNFLRKMFTVVITSSSEQRKIWLHEVKELSAKFLQEMCRSEEHRTYHTDDHGFTEL